MKNIIKSLIFISLIFVIVGCGTYNFRSIYESQNSLMHASDSIKTKLFLKAHMKNGNICVFKDSWQIDTAENVLKGKGVLYDFNRHLINENVTVIPIDSVLLFETNKKLEGVESSRIAALSLLTALDVTLGLYCMTIPKACFGSCPTFYVDENLDKGFHYADAEGFSSSILPSFDKSDIDAINSHFVETESFRLTMKNEALETHCIDEVKLLVYPVGETERVFHSNADKFYLCKQPEVPTSAMAEEGSIRDLIASPDKVERFSLADSKNLSTREEVCVTFDGVVANKNYGMILDFRQTLMSTFLFYNTMGYLGDEASDYYARIEKSDFLKQRLECINDELGGIEVFVFNDSENKWDFQGKYYELGPIAINSQFLPVKTDGSVNQLKVKLRLNKGTWRIDRIGLAEIIAEVNPQVLNPVSIEKNNNPSPETLKKNNNPKDYIISMPGNNFSFNFQVPEPGIKYEMFLYSKGYYLEWMRNDWMKEKNISELREMYLRPQRYLKKHAKEFKLYENNMEDIFWNSKINTNLFSYEN